MRAGGGRRSTTLCEFRLFLASLCALPACLPCACAVPNGLQRRSRQRRVFAASSWTPRRKERRTIT
jgi:hypothetical protein